MDTLNLKQLKLRNFRSHKSLDLDFSSNFVYFSGPNGVGKTNILEAISLFSPGRGLRGASISDLTLSQSETFWNLSSLFKISNVFIELEIGLDKKGKKTLRVDGKNKPLIYLTEILKIIWITPLMDRLWIGGSSERRRFLDRLVMNFFPNHAKNCVLYEHALKKRNFLFKENVNDIAWFLAVEKQLAEIGYLIDKNRREVIEIIIEMQISMEQNGHFPILKLELDTYPIKNGEDLFEELQKSRKTDFNAKRTLIGPHRDDFILTLDGRSAADFGSEGQQRTMALALKLGQGRLLEKKRNASPVYLIDDVFGELDPSRRNALMDYLPASSQKLITTTSLSWMDGEAPPLFKVAGGAVIAE